MSQKFEKSVALYPGSFDPITLGHADIIHRLAGFYDSIVVLVANSPSKTQMFSAEERIELIRSSLPDIKNLVVDRYDGLTVDYAQKIGAKVILRGLRAVADFEYEFAMANMNRRLAPELETMIVFTRTEYSFVSSRMVKEVAMNGGSLNSLVPPPVADALVSRVALMKQKN